MHLAARIAITTLVAAVGVVLMMAIAVGFFGLVLSPADMPGLVATFLLGSAVFCVLGVAVTPLMPTVESSQAIATATLYPMLFLSGVFFPIDGAPTFVRAIIAALPGRPFVLLLQRPFLADSAALGPMLPQVLVLLAWGIAGAVLALRTMRWEPGNSPG